jgi:hypothetical protein
MSQYRTSRWLTDAETGEATKGQARARLTYGGQRA